MSLMSNRDTVCVSWGYMHDFLLRIGQLDYVEKPLREAEVNVRPDDKAHDQFSIRSELV